MPAPTSYTEEGLAAYMHRQLGAIADDLGWTVDGGSYADAVDEVALAAGSAIADATNVSYLRALARREAWWMVMQATAGDYDVKSGEQAISRHQVHTQAKTNWTAASAAVHAVELVIAADLGTAAQSGSSPLEVIW